MDSKIALCFLFCIFYTAYGEVDIITEPRPGEEYVLVSSGQQTPLRNFETSHKIPEKHPNYRLTKPEDGDIKIFKKLNSGKLKHPTEGIISIEEDKKALFKKGQKNKASESIEVDIPTSKLEDIKIKENLKSKDFNSKMAVDLEAMSESGKLRNKDVITTQKPILTTSGSASSNAYDYIPINFDTIDEVNSGLLSSNVKLESAGSEQKQHSRIQVKKGPNGQDYEYEYIYYYYDEDEDPEKKVKDKAVSSAASTTTSTTTTAPVQKLDNENKIFKESKSRTKYTTLDRSSTTTVAAPEVHNEVLPAVGRSRSRGRNVAPAPVEEESHEERLPSSTRFPPRGRSFAAASSTTYVPEVTSETRRHRGRSQVDSVAVESTGQTRSRTRGHIRRPSSELVDLDSFKVHSGDIPAPYKEQPSRYSSESKTTTEFVEVLPTIKEPSIVKETQREGHSLQNGAKIQEILDDSKLPSDFKQTTTYEQDTTEYTTMTAMEKVALDLYAYLAGENLNNEISSSSDLMSFDESTPMDDDSWTTESFSTTEEETTPTTTTTTSTTTTTTTTTTTPEPTTTTTTAPTRPSRFKGRAGARSRSSASTSAATEAPQETSTRVKGRFGKPSGHRKTTAAAVESSSSATPVEKPAQPKPFGRRGLFGGRTRPSSTTAAPGESPSSSVASEAPVARSRLRPALRKLPSSTSAAPSSADASESTSPSSAGAAAVEAETTPTPVRTLGRKPGSRPVSLRPGPRLNIRPNIRVRPGVSSVATTEAASEAPAEIPASESPATDAEPEGSSPSPAPEQPRGLLKIRNRLQVSATPKPRAAVTAPLRRPNPLLKKRLPTTEATTEAPKKSTEAAEEVTSAEKSESEAETEAPVAETTAAPQLRGLDALIARRRAAGIGGRPARPVRRAPFPK